VLLPHDLCFGQTSVAHPAPAMKPLWPTLHLPESLNSLSSTKATLCACNQLVREKERLAIQLLPGFDLIAASESLPLHINHYQLVT